MDRRRFLMWMSFGGTLGSLSVALLSCSAQTEEKGTERGSPEVFPGVSSDDRRDEKLRSDGFEPIGSVSELDSSLQLAGRLSSGVSVLVVRRPGDRERLDAVDPVCTHKACRVSWQSEREIFVCPCHGAIYNSKGKGIAGPFTGPLAAYEARIEGEEVLVKAL